MKILKDSLTDKQFNPYCLNPGNSDTKYHNFKYIIQVPSPVDDVTYIYIAKSYMLTDSITPYSEFTFYGFYCIPINTLYVESGHLELKYSYTYLQYKDVFSSINMVSLCSVIDEYVDKINNLFLEKIQSADASDYDFSEDDKEIIKQVAYQYYIQGSSCHEFTYLVTTFSDLIFDKAYVYEQSPHRFNNILKYFTAPEEAVRNELSDILTSLFDLNYNTALSYAIYHEVERLNAEHTDIYKKTILSGVNGLPTTAKTVLIRFKKCIPITDGESEERIFTFRVNALNISNTEACFDYYSIINKKERDAYEKLFEWRYRSQMAVKWEEVQSITYGYRLVYDKKIVDDFLNKEKTI